jgi:hypothetical protein
MQFGKANGQEGGAFLIMRQSKASLPTINLMTLLPWIRRTINLCSILEQEYILSTASPTHQDHSAMLQWKLKKMCCPLGPLHIQVKEQILKNDTHIWNQSAAKVSQSSIQD